MMRLLGNCPNCKEEDSLVVARESDKAVCTKCEEAWAWPKIAEEKGFIAVLVDVWPHSAILHCYDTPVPCVQLIATVLNTALVVRFGLRPCAATEGGVEGVVKNERIELQNFGEETIGLYSEYKTPVSQEVLCWYGKLLRILCEEDLRFKEMDLGRGRIFKLGTGDCKEEVVKCLWAALCKKASQKFANKVLRKAFCQPVSPYTRGLTDKEIIGLYEYPPRGR